MTVWVTSDTHFGHERIISLCDRPFASVEEMNEALIANWNACVAPTDHVYHLGDVALGNFDESMACLKRLNGVKTLVVGNHDRLFIDPEAKRLEKAHRYVQRFLPVYREVFKYIEMGTLPGNEEGKAPSAAQTLIIPEMNVSLRNGKAAKTSVSDVWRMSHFPYTGDSHDKPRYDLIRPVDDGKVLLHGHTHQSNVVTRSAKGTLQVHVGVDSWGYRPVAMEEIREIVDAQN